MSDGVLDLTFRDIEQGLVDLVRQREECETPEDIDRCDLAITAYLKAEVAKVDGVAAFIQAEEAAASVAASEIERLEELRRKRLARAGRVRDMALRVMQETDQRVIEGQRHTLKVKRNPPAVEIAQPDLVPDNMRRYTLTLEPNDMRVLFETSESTQKLAAKAKSEPSKSAIKAALAAGGGVPGAHMVTRERLEVE